MGARKQVGIGLKHEEKLSEASKMNLLNRSGRSDVLPDRSTNHVLPFPADFSPAQSRICATNTRNRRVHAEIGTLVYTRVCRSESYLVR